MHARVRACVSVCESAHTLVCVYGWACVRMRLLCVRMFACVCASMCVCVCVCVDRTFKHDFCLSGLHSSFVILFPPFFLSPELFAGKLLLVEVGLGELDSK